MPTTKRLAAGQDRSDGVVHGVPQAMAAAALARRAAATSTPTAQEASRVSSESARLVRMIGHARAEHDAGGVGAGQERQALGQHVAGLEVGHDQHVGPAGDRRDDVLDRGGLEADGVVEGQRAVEDGAGDLAAIGHLARAPPPRSSTAPSGLTVSMALRIATRTSAYADAHAPGRSAFCTMSTLTSSVGAMFTAASVMISASGWPGTSMTKQWLMRRAVRMPVSRATTAPISSSVCRLPFIRASARPASHELDGLGSRVVAVLESTSSKAPMSRPALAATSRDARRAGRPGSASGGPSRAASDRAFQRNGIAGMRDRRRHRPDACAARSTRRSYFWRAAGRRGEVVVRHWPPPTRWSLAATPNSALDPAQAAAGPPRARRRARRAPAAGPSSAVRRACSPSGSSGDGAHGAFFVEAAAARYWSFRAGLQLGRCSCGR